MKKKYCMEEIEYIELKYKQIQKRYKFQIPKYILRELASSSYNKKELCMLINMAVINKRITEYEGKILKKEYCFRKYITTSNNTNYKKGQTQSDDE